MHLRPIVSLLASMLAAYSRCNCRLASSTPMYDATYSKGSLHRGLEEHTLSYIGQPKGSTTSCISIESDACLICMDQYGHSDTPILPKWKRRMQMSLIHSRPDSGCLQELVRASQSASMQKKGCGKPSKSGAHNQRRPGRCKRRLVGIPEACGVQTEPCWACQQRSVLRQVAASAQAWRLRWSAAPR